MPSMKSVVSAVVFSAAALGIVSAGCKSSTTSDSTRKSTKGEVCQTTNDCADGLDCVPRASEPGGLCVNGEFNVAPTAKECAVIQCANPVDCCPAVPQGIDCPTLNNECQQFGPTSSYCTEYKQYCACDGTKYQCTNGSCLSICQTATDCGGGNFQCNNGHCVECTSDSQCTNGLVCDDSGACVAPCKSDTDCSAFNRCANGHCSATGGCQTDRECIASTKNVTATCASGTCVVPCQSDLECGNPEEYTFYSCIQNQCIYVGCQTDKECQLYLGTGGVQPGGKHQQIVCRDKAAK
jgi:Cys-rich repeat protein